MVRRQVLLRTQFAGEARPGHHAQAVVEQVLAAQGGVGGPGDLDGEVDASGAQFRLQVRPVQAVAAYLDARRGLAQVGEDRREHQRLQLLRHVQLEGPRVAPRVERLAAIHAAVQAGEGVMDARRQSLGQRRRRNPAPLADEQRVAELVAQARQGVADGRLAEMQEARRAGQVAFSIDHFEDPEQVQIETAEGRPFMWLIHVCARLSGEGASLAGMLADRTMYRLHGCR